MMSIERDTSSGMGKRSRYMLVESSDRGLSTIAVIEGLRPAACVLRFLRGSHLETADYRLAIKTMAEIDSKEGGV